MNASQPYIPLRTKLIATTVIVQLVLLLLLVFNFSRVSDHLTQEIVERRVSELNTLLSAALTPSMVANDFAEASDLMEEMRGTGQLDYLVIYDRQGQPVAASGWKLNQRVPPSSTLPDIASGQTQFHAVAPLSLAGQVYGDLRYGFTIQHVVRSMQDLYWQSMLIVGLSIVLSAWVLILFGLPLTRALGRLAQATDALAVGETDVRLPVERNDEIGQVAISFNGMADQLRWRMEALKQNERRLYAIANHTHGCEMWIEPGGRLIWVNPEAIRVTGYTPEACMAMADFPLPLISPSDRADMQRRLNEGMTHRSREEVEFCGLKADGTEYWAIMSWLPIFGAEDEYFGMRASIRDASHEKDSQIVLSQAVIELQHAQAMQQRYLDSAEEEKARLTALLGAMAIGILFVDRHDKVIYHNNTFVEQWQLPPDFVAIGQHLATVLAVASNAPEPASDPPVMSGAALLGKTVLEELVMADGRVILRHSHPVVGDNHIALGQVWVFEDVTEIRLASERLVYLAERDSLTGLYNRHRFQQDLARELSMADHHGRSCGLLFFDLDEFKYVNDTFGHGAGDMVLVRVAREIELQVRQNELLYRLGGDEFALLIPDANLEAIGAMAERIVKSVSRVKVDFEGQLLRMGTSVGVALYPIHAASGEDLVANADMAMYQAKAAGKNTWRAYSPDQTMMAELVERWSWSDRIQSALDQGLFELHYQGIYEAGHQRLTHLEALLRMRDLDDPTRMIPPGQFIVVAEKTGKILEIDRWVIRQVITMLAERSSLLPISVNISGRSFDDPTLPAFIADQLQQNGVNPSRLYVEVTETAAVSDLQDAEHFIDALRATGCHVCLDDFGAGFSSFTYLKHLKADVLKIDGQFVRNLPNDTDSQVFVQGMVAMAHGLGKLTVAEFVEDQATLEMLISFGVDMVQGYYLDQPRADHPALASMLQA
ncbi:EAL domain-containing protein [Chitinivorax sp. B]|uniref:EAL domain-containing protein n=1 Tax=Chitinivorax sp. B TaxID=2502235 RepID=UPI0010F491A6|nr:EAL domain-containing protein [Chitinivorax sp. B]